MRGRALDSSIISNIIKPGLFRSAYRLFPSGTPLAVYTGIVADRSSRENFQFFFYSADRDEPPHVHVERDEGKAKFWLEPVRLEGSRGFVRVEIGRIQRLVEENAAFFVEIMA